MSQAFHLVTVENLDRTYCRNRMPRYTVNPGGNKIMVDYLIKCVIMN